MASYEEQYQSMLQRLSEIQVRIETRERRPDEPNSEETDPSQVAIDGIDKEAELYDTASTKARKLEIEVQLLKNKNFRQIINLPRHFQSVRKRLYLFEGSERAEMERKLDELSQEVRVLFEQL